MRIGDVFEVFRTAREEKVRYLERVPIFEACSLRQLRAVADISKVVEVPERTVLTRQGEAGDEFFIIIDGTALVTLSLHKRHRLRPGEFFGEMSLLDGEPRSATVKAETDLRVLVINRRALLGAPAGGPGADAADARQPLPPHPRPRERDEHLKAACDRYAILLAFATLFALGMAMRASGKAVQAAATPSL